MNRLTVLWIAALIGALAVPVLAGNNAEYATPRSEWSPVASPELTQQEEFETEGLPATTHFLRAAGSNFHPRDSVVEFSYRGSGCVQRNTSGGDSWFSYDLDIPEGAVIDFLRVYYYDQSPTHDIDSELWAFDGAGGTTLVAEADGSGSPGYSSAGSGFFAHPVDSAYQALVVVASIPSGAGSDLALCGVRVRYQLDDPIFSDGFESGDTTLWSTAVP